MIGPPGRSVKGTGRVVRSHVPASNTPGKGVSRPRADIV